MSFITKLNLQDNRQHKLDSRKSHILEGISELGVVFSALTSGPDSSDSGVTSTVYNVVSTFSGDSGTTIFIFGDARMNLAVSTLDPITDANSGITQTTGFVFTGHTPQVLDGNLSYLGYSGVSFDFEVTAITETTPGVFTGSGLSLDVDILSAGTLDYTDRTIWIDVKGIAKTDRLMVTNSAVAGYVLTSDSVGNATWQASSGATSGATGGTSLWSASTGTNAIAPIDQSATASGLNSVAIGNATAAGDYSFASGLLNTTSGDYSAIIGGSGNTNTGIGSIILGGSGNTLTHNNSHILGESLSSKAENTSHFHHTHSYGDCVVQSDTTYMIPSTFKGNISNFEWDGVTIMGISNGDTGGTSTRASLTIGDLSLAGFIAGRFGQLTYNGPSYLVGDAGAETGVDFYKNKVLLKASLGTDGLIFSVGDPVSDFHWELDKKSRMILNGTGLGLGLGVSGITQPTHTLEVGTASGTSTSLFVGTVDIEGTLNIVGDVNITGTTISSSWDDGAGTLSATEDDLSTSSTSALRLVAAGGTGTTITGLADGFDGKDLVLTNDGLFSVTFKHEDVGSSASNRIRTVGNSDIVVTANGSITLKYAGGSFNPANRWRVISHT